MRHHQEFDRFYGESRERVLADLFARCGDLDLARTATREAFVHTWQRWRTVRSASDPAAAVVSTGATWLRQHGVAVDSNLDGPDHSADDSADNESDDGRDLVAGRLPPATEIRRSGGRQRLVFAAVGLVATAVVLTAGGHFVTDTAGVEPTLVKPSASPTPKPPAEPTLNDGRLLADDQVDVLARDRSWQTVRTTNNTDGPGLYTPCQETRFADPDGSGARVRTWRTEDAGPRIDAVQSTELSQSRKAASAAFSTLTKWYSGCLAPGTQLLSTYRLDGVGNGARIFLFRTWGDTPTMTAVGIGRTRLLTTSVIRTEVGASEPGLFGVRDLLSEAVDRLCAGPGGGPCSEDPRLEETAPQPTGTSPGLLSTLDLPQAGGINASWAATRPTRAETDPVTIACGTSDFSKEPVVNGRTRTYVIPNGRDLPEEFGLSEDAGTLPDPAAATEVVDAATERMDSCEDDQEGTEVSQISDQRSKALDVVAWRVRTEVEDGRTIEQLIALVRNGDSAAQLNLVTAPNASFDDEAFVALAQRASMRLEYMAEQPKRPAASPSANQSAKPSASPSASPSGD